MKSFHEKEQLAGPGERLVVLVVVLMIVGFISLGFAVTSGPDKHESWSHAALVWKMITVIGLAPLAVIIVTVVMAGFVWLVNWFITGKDLFE